MRLPFLRPQSDAGGADRSAPAVEDSSTLQAARTHARRRLMGAVVLLVVAVAGFPLLFETQPRPLPGRGAGDGSAVVIRTDGVARGNGADNPPARAEAVKPPPAVAAAPSAAVAAGSTEATADRKALAPALEAASAPLAQAAAPVVAAAASKPAAAAKKSEAAASAPVKPVAAPPAAAKAASAAAAVAAKPDKAEKVQKSEKAVPAAAAAAAAASTPSAAPAAAASSTDGTARWVVQVGAYNDMERMRGARQKAEKLGFKTYTTEVDTPTGKRTRVRLGPFASKKEAEAAAAKVKANGMAANILSL